MKKVFVFMAVLIVTIAFPAFAQFGSQPAPVYELRLLYMTLDNTNYLGLYSGRVQYWDNQGLHYNLYCSDGSYEQYSFTPVGFYYNFSMATGPYKLYGTATRTRTPNYTEWVLNYSGGGGQMVFRISNS
jgi:hypothetical protein